MKFKALMTDFDGTLTRLGVYVAPEEVTKELIRVARKFPVAICTGRELSSFEGDQLGGILRELDEQSLDEVLKNFFIIGENGCVGAYFDTELERFEEFYRGQWPREFIGKLKLKKMLNEALAKWGEWLEDPELTLVIQPNKEHKKTLEQRFETTTIMAEIIRKILWNIDKDYENFLHVNDSGNSVLIVPAQFDKDHGVVKFAEFLNETRGETFDAGISEMLLIGDKALPGGNDFSFLSGKFGIAYTVGDYDKNSKKPLAVEDEDGKRLLSFEGTLKLLRDFF